MICALDTTRIIFENSAGWLLACAVIGALYTYLLYPRSAEWPGYWKWGLSTFRFLSVTFIAALLLEPLFHHAYRKVLPAQYRILLDNSASIRQASSPKEVKQLHDFLSTYTSELTEKGVDWKIETFDSAYTTLPESIPFAYGETDLNGLIKKGLADINQDNKAGLLISDGIVNAGISPAYYPYPMQLDVLGIGDTVPPRDIAIAHVRYNKTSFQGNQFPVEVQLTQQGMDGKSVALQLEEEGQVIARQSVNFAEGQHYQDVTFKVKANAKGWHHYKVVLKDLQDENLSNNSKDFFVQVISSQKHILILAAAPHPDIKAIRSVLEQTSQYKIDVAIAGIAQAVPRSSYDLVVLYQLPNTSRTWQATIQKFEKNRTPLWFVVGPKTDFRGLNNANGLIQFEDGQRAPDEIQAQLNTGFSLFQLPSQTSAVLSTLPPVMMPYGKLTQKSGEAMLWATMGGVQTQRPVWVLSGPNQAKQAITFFHNFWYWPLQEYKRNRNKDIFNALVASTARYLMTGEKEGQFVVKADKEHYSTADKITFQIRTLNQLLEPLSGVPVKISLQREGKEVARYGYQTVVGQRNYIADVLSPGLYTYVAKANFEGKEWTQQGSFSVEEQQLEASQLTADHHLLRKIAQQNSGSFYNLNEQPKLLQKVKAQNFSGTLQTTTQEQPFVSWPWLWVLIFSLLGVEWGFRKFLGKY